MEEGQLLLVSVDTRGLGCTKAAQNALELVGNVKWRATQPDAGTGSRL